MQIFIAKPMNYSFISLFCWNPAMVNFPRLLECVTIYIKYCSEFVVLNLSTASLN